MKCPPGFYCPTGTQTGDPFRNDTIMRPYACPPGSYCLSGVGYETIKKGDYRYPQPCTQGFYCESACTSPLGSGICPKGFICPEGTAVPQPAPKGYQSSMEGIVKPAMCLPGFYAPVAQSSDCYPCPPGTSCEDEGTSVADICPPGTYRSFLAIDGLSCVSCPQGTWSKNWQLREKGECTTCPTGTVCPVEGNTIPCGWSDLPTPFEPVVNDKGVAMPEYLYSIAELPPYFSSFQCLALNPMEVDGTVDPLYQEYFFGELIPPYVDVLGRGPHFRATDEDNIKYQSTAKCYKNTQRYGSTVYQRFADYYGPQFDIQMGYGYQGYGNGSNYDGFWGTGSQYIDLDQARIFDAAYNCSRGFQLMNESLSSAKSQIVYTDAENDPTGAQRKIYKGSDYWYRGTCEADIICDLNSPGKSRPCAEGYVCDELSTQETSIYYRCRQGYVCDFGTTPDPSLEAPAGQFNKLCPLGYYCLDGTGRGQQMRAPCPENHFCPTGTANPYLGFMAGDSINRGLSKEDANPFQKLTYLKHFSEVNDVRLISLHDQRCFNGIDIDLKARYHRRFISSGTLSNNINVNYLNELRVGQPPYTNDYRDTGDKSGAYYRSSVINVGIDEKLLCGRDHKWRLVSDAINREECDCVKQVYVIIAVYRLWKCTGSSTPLDDLGLGSVNDPFNGGRSFWFTRIDHSTTVCSSSHHATHVNLTTGLIYHGADAPGIGAHNNGLRNLTHGVELQFTYTRAMNFTNFAVLKTTVEREYDEELTELIKGNRKDMDPFVYDLRYAVRLIEEFGERLEELVWLDLERDADGALSYRPGRLDMCECERLNRCPNGTTSSDKATSIYDCVKTGEVLLRINAIPTFLENSSHVRNMSDFKELGGPGDFSIGTIALEPLEVAVITLNMNETARNLTYNEHWQLSVYVDCKPCPPRYICDYAQTSPTCTTPSYETQLEAYEACLKEHRVWTCVNSNGTQVSCDADDVYQTASFHQPDLHKCRQIPFFCDEQKWDYLTWNVLKDPFTGLPLSGQVQETSDYRTVPRSKPYQVTPGCCACERHSLPSYFQDTTADFGFSDNKHNMIQLTMQPVKATEVTVVLELLNGLYYSDFRKGMVDKGDLAVYTPGRAKFTNPGEASFTQFYSVIARGDFDDTMELPFNLPWQRTRIRAQEPDKTEITFEDTLLLGRITDLRVGDPQYYDRLFARRYQEALLSGQDDDSSIPVNVPVYEDDGIQKNAALYPVQNSISDVARGFTWWDSADTEPMTFLTLPYLPFFSNCDGYDNYMSIGKLLETHPDCELVNYDKTRHVNQYPWYGMFSPLGDRCQAHITADERTDRYGNVIYDSSAKLKGIDLQCHYEEDVENPAGNPRWFEVCFFADYMYVYV